MGFGSARFSFRLYHTMTQKNPAVIANARGNNKNAGIGKGPVVMTTATMMTDMKKIAVERQSSSLTIGSSFIHTTGCQG